MKRCGRLSTWPRRARTSSTSAGNPPALAPTRLPEAEELARVLPVVKALAPALPGRISVDTYKARVAAQALEAGAFMINDISALRMDPEMVAVVRDADCPVILMHMLGEPKTMQVEPTYGDVVEEVYGFFAERIGVGGGERAERGEPADRPWAGLRQDHGAQPGVAPRSRRLPVAGPADSARGLAQTVPGGDTRHRHGERAGRGHRRHHGRGRSAQAPTSSECTTWRSTGTPPASPGRSRRGG